jgi:hypothetical protein
LAEAWLELAAKIDQTLLFSNLVGAMTDVFRVEVKKDGELEVASGDFRAVYYKPHDKPQLILRHRTETDDHALLAMAWQAANDKARELGWIV